MKLNLDFALYRGKTRLRDWWKAVKSHFIEVQDAVNELDDATDELAQALEDEAAERERVDGVLFDNITDAAAAITAETSARKAADNTLDGKIKAEAAARQSADNELRGNLVDIAAALVAETAAREEAETNINNDIEILKSTAHTHDNKEILDAIDAERVQKWDSIKEQVTQEQLDTVNDYLEDIAFGHERELHIIYTALGVEHYNGSLFGTPYDDDDLDGGDFDSEPEITIDFGGFEPMTIFIPSGEITDIIDGGDFSNTTGKVIDGGTY